MHPHKLLLVFAFLLTFVTAEGKAAPIACEDLPDFYFPVNGNPPKGTVVTGVSGGFGHVRNRYNTGSSCGYLKREDVQIWFQVAPAVKNAKAAPWLFFINGGPGIPYGFRDKQFLKLRDKYNLVWFSQRGTGLSRLTLAQSNDCKIVNLSQNVLDLRALQQMLSPNQPVVFLSHSWGGLLAQEFAAQYPNSTAAVVFSGTGVGFDFVHQALAKGNPLLYPYQEYLNALFKKASPEAIARYNAAIQKVTTRLETGIPVHLGLGSWSDSRGDLMLSRQFFITLKAYFGKTHFDSEPVLVLLEEIADGKFEPNGLAELGIDSWGNNMILNNTVLCTDALPNVLGSLPKDTVDLVTLGCEEIAPECQSKPTDFEDLARHVAAPTLILAASNDKVEPLEEQRQLAQLISNAKFIELPNAAHGAILQQNFDAFPAILKFLGISSNWTADTWQDELR